MPLRVMTSEIECDLACEEAIFDAAHPFTRPEFTFKRSMTVKTAFRALFNGAPQEPGAKSDLSMLDTFVSQLAVQHWGVV